jgi:hypothetical protein
MKRTSQCFGIIVLTALSFRQSAQAQDSSAAADVLFQQGRSALQAGDYATACPKLTDSYRLDPATGTLLALAMCHEAQGKNATAWSEYAEVAIRAKRDGRPDREQAALEKVESLKGRLSHLTIRLSAEARSQIGVRVLRDGIEVGSGSLGVSLPVDAGVHQIQASAPGKRSFSTQVTVALDGASEIVVIPLLADSVPASTPKAAPKRASAAPTQEGTTTSPPAWTRLEIAGAIVAGVGVVGLGVGSAFGLHALSEKNASEKDCDSNNRCGSQEAFQARKDSVAAADRATIAFVAGGVLLAGGATLYIVGHRSRSEKSPYVSATPYAFPGAAGLALGGQF